MLLPRTVQIRFDTRARLKRGQKARVAFAPRLSVVEADPGHLARALQDRAQNVPVSQWNDWNDWNNGRIGTMEGLEQ